MKSLFSGGKQWQTKCIKNDSMDLPLQCDASFDMGKHGPSNVERFKKMTMILSTSGAFFYNFLFVYKSLEEN
jgi:hypothetical protein